MPTLSLSLSLPLPLLCQLKRAWQALPLLQKIELTFTLLRGASLDASEEALQALQSDDALSAMYAAMGERFPALMGPLIHERDMVSVRLVTT